MNPTIGTKIEAPRGEVWDCMDCRLVHIPDVANYLLNLELQDLVKKAERKIKYF